MKKIIWNNKNIGFSRLRHAPYIVQVYINENDVTDFIDKLFTIIIFKWLINREDLSELRMNIVSI